jgi:hypothetical protein
MSHVFVESNCQVHSRCYITLTQSLHLFVGGAPAGAIVATFVSRFDRIFFVLREQAKLKQPKVNNLCRKNLVNKHIQCSIDLGRSLGVCVFVTNCSEQIDYKSIGNTFKGLSMRYDQSSRCLYHHDITQCFRVCLLADVGDVSMSTYCSIVMY